MKKLLTVLICMILAVPSMWAGKATITASVSGQSTGSGEVVASTSSSTPTAGWTSGTSGPVSKSGTISKPTVYAHARTLDDSGSAFSHWIVDGSSTTTSNPYKFEVSRLLEKSASVAAVFYKIIDCTTTEINIMKAAEETKTAEFNATVFKAKNISRNVVKDKGNGTATITCTHNITDDTKQDATFTITAGAGVMDGDEFTITLTGDKGAKHTVKVKVFSSIKFYLDAPTVGVGSYTYKRTDGQGTNGTISVGSASVEILKEGDEVYKLEGVDNASTGYRFDKWVVTHADGTKSEELANPYTYTIVNGDRITAEFIKNDYAIFKILGKDALSYNHLDDAIAATAGTGVVYVYQSGKLLSGNYTIPANVTLLIPGDDANTVCTGDVNNERDYIANATSSCKKYLTMENNTTITVASNAAISIYSKMTYTQPYNGKPITYGRLDMGDNCHIVVQSNAVLSVLGYITGNPNTSDVTIELGGLVYESFQIRDWRGGTTATEVAGASTSDLLKILYTDFTLTGTKQKVFPVGQYYIQSVETKLILEAGAIEKITTAANMSLSSYNIVMAANAPFVVPDNNNYPSGLFRLGTGTRFEKYYDREKDRQCFSVVGSTVGKQAKFAVMELSFPVKTIDTHNLTVSSQYYVLPITNNIDVTLDNIDITTSYDMALLGDASVTIEEDATLTIDGGSRIFVSDKEESKHMWYGASAGNATINPVYYTPSNSQYLLDASGNKISSKSDVVVKDTKMYTTTAGNLYKRQVDDLTDYAGEIAMKDGRIVVNGKLHVKNGYLYTTASGADITSDGGGKVQFDKVDHSTDDKYYRYLQAAQGDLEIGFHAIPVTNAKLHNDEENNPTQPYSAGENANADETYTYVQSLGKWMLPQNLQINTTSGNTFSLTLPNNVTQNVVCDVSVTKGEVSIANFSISPLSNESKFTLGKATFADGKLTIPVTYNAQNDHGIEVEEYLTVTCNDLTGTSEPKEEVITLRATEDYTPKFNVSISGTEYAHGSTFSITNAYVNDELSFPVVILADENNVANELATWTPSADACADPFEFTYGTKTAKPYANAELVYAPKDEANHVRTLSITATYKDGTGEAQKKTLTITLNGTSNLRQNPLAFAEFPQPIYTTTPQFELIDQTTNVAGSSIEVTPKTGIVTISGDGISTPYMVTPNSIGVVTITATQEKSQAYHGTSIYKTIAVIGQDINPVPFCVDKLEEFNKYLLGGKNVSYNTTNNTVEFTSTASSSEWVLRFNGTPDKLTFTPIGNNTWNIQQRSSETAEWKDILVWSSLTSNEEVTYQLEPTTCQVRIQYGSANAEVGALKNVCVSELLISANVDKLYMPIYADKTSDKTIILTHTQDVIPNITLAPASGLIYSAEKSKNLGTDGAPYYNTTVTISTTEATVENEYEFTATEDGNTVKVKVSAYTFPQELPIKLATDDPDNGDRYYFVTTASSYAQWDAANRQIVFQNPGAQLMRSVTFAFNGAPSIISFETYSVDGAETIVDSDWTIEESIDGVLYQPSLLARESDANTLLQNLNYTTRYVRVKYNSVHLQEIRLSNLVIEGYPRMIVNPERMTLTSSTSKQTLEAIAINLQNVDFKVDNTAAFQITADTTYLTGLGEKVSATPDTHESALGINKVDTIFLGVKWLEHSALDEGTITIINKDDGSILSVVTLLGSNDYLIKENATNSGIYTGIPDGKKDTNNDGEISPEESKYRFTFHGAEYTDYNYHPVDLTNAFAEDGTALFDYLFIYGETTPASGENITAPKKWTGDDNTSSGSNAVTPLYVYKKALNADTEYKGYQFVVKVDNVNTSAKTVVEDIIVQDSQGVIYVDAQDQSKNLRVYMTGFCPYATTGDNKLQEGVFLFRGKHGSKIDVYLEDFHVFSRNKTTTGHAFDGKDGGNDFTDGYVRGSGGVLVFENVDIQEQLQNYDPFEVSIHMMGNNLLKSNYGCFYALHIDNTVAMKATQVSSPIQVHVLYRDAADRYNERKTKTTINIDDIWPVAVDANNFITDSKRTNGFLGLKKLANNAPSIDLGNKNTIVNFNGGRVELQNSQIATESYKTTLAISHRSGYFGADKGVQLCYGIGTDSVGGVVNFLDGTVTVERMYVEPAYRQYYLMDEEETGYTTCLRTPKNTFIRGGSICRVRACQHVTSKGGAPKDRETGKFLGQYVYTLQGNDQLNTTTNLAKIVEFPSNVEGLKLYHQNSAYTYGLNSVTPDTKNQYYFWIPDGFGGVTAERDKYMSIWKACMTEIGAGIEGVAEGSVGGDTPIEPNEEVKYFLYCQIDKNIHDVISAHNVVGDGQKDYTYMAPIEVPTAAQTAMGKYMRWAPNYVSDSLEYQVTSDTTYTITDRVYYVTTATADVWKTFAAPFDVANIYVVETYSENELQNDRTRSQILKEQARHNADFAAFFAVAMAMGTDKSFEKIYNSYLEWAKIEDNHSDENGKYTLRSMQKLTPYFGNNWRDANFYLNVNRGNWEFSDDNRYQFKTKWQLLNQTDTTDGILLHKDSTYSLMFPYCPGCEDNFDERDYWDYWSGKFLIFESTDAPQTINGRDFLNETKESNIFTLSPDENKVIVTGNSTFARLETDREDIHVYEDGSDGLGGGTYNSEYFSMKEDPSDIVSIQPTTAFLYGNVPVDPITSMPAKKVTREGKIIYGGSGNNNGDPNNGTTTGSHTPTVGGDNDMFITAIDGGINIAVAAPQMVCVVNATGHILYNGYVTTNTNVLLPMNGIYVVKGQNEVQKIFF